MSGRSFLIILTGEQELANLIHIFISESPVIIFSSWKWLFSKYVPDSISKDSSATVVGWLCACFHFTLSMFHACVCLCVCLCACVRKSLGNYRAWRRRDKWIPCLQEKNTLEAQEKTFVVYEEHVKPIKSELSSCCSSSCRLQFLVRSPAVSPPGEQICVCAWSLQTHMQWTHMHPQRQKDCTGLTVSSVSATFSWWWRWKMQSYS